MKRPIQVGQFCAAMISALDDAADGDTFLLPTAMHLHAFQSILTEMNTPKRVTLQVIGE